MPPYESGNVAYPFPCPPFWLCFEGNIPLAASDDIVCAFPALPDAIGELSHVRGTLLASSMQSLRSRGLFERYSALLSDSYRDRVLNSVAGEWLTTEIALAHYRACDALRLSVEDQIGMGRDVSRRTHETFLGLLVKMARGVGVTPWVVFPKINSLYMRIFRGGGIQITRLSPKDARVQTLGLSPLAITPISAMPTLACTKPASECLPRTSRSARSRSPRRRREKTSSCT